MRWGRRDVRPRSPPSVERYSDRGKRTSSLTPSQRGSAGSLGGRTMVSAEDNRGCSQLHAGRRAFAQRDGEGKPHAATAIDAQPTRNAAPPSGVTAPSQRMPVSVIT